MDMAADYADGAGGWQARKVFQGLENHPPFFPRSGKVRAETFQCLEKLPPPLSNPWKLAARGRYSV
jgi:hypothetical protein